MHSYMCNSSPVKYHRLFCPNALVSSVQHLNHYKCHLQHGSKYYGINI